MKMAILLTDTDVSEFASGFADALGAALAGGYAFLARA